MTDRWADIAARHERNEWMRNWTVHQDRAYLLRGREFLQHKDWCDVKELTPVTETAKCTCRLDAYLRGEP